MGEFHHVKLWMDERGHRCRIEIDGREIHGALSVRADVAGDLNPPTVRIELIPRTLEVEGAAEIDMYRKILPITTGVDR